MSMTHRCHLLLVTALMLLGVVGSGPAAVAGAVRLAGDPGAACGGPDQTVAPAPAEAPFGPCSESDPDDGDPFVAGALVQPELVPAHWCASERGDTVARGNRPEVTRVRGPPTGAR